MEPHYDDSFSKRYRDIPAAYYLHRFDSRDGYPWIAEDGSYTYTNPHNHAELELLLFERGRGINRIGDARTPIPFCEGDLFLFNPFELHGGCYSAGTPAQQHLCIDFSVSLLEHPQLPTATKLSGKLLSQSVRITNRIPPDDPAYPELRQAYLAMWRVLNEAPEDEMSFFGALYCFFGTLQRYGHIHEATAPSAPATDTAFIKNVLDYISAHYAEPISTRDVAAALRYSKEHFCRLFKASFRVTFIEYLTQFRIERAKRELADRSSMEVAARCGFSGQSNFSRAFRAALGISPSAYRRVLVASAEKKSDKQ